MPNPSLHAACGSARATCASTSAYATATLRATKAPAYCCDSGAPQGGWQRLGAGCETCDACSAGALSTFLDGD